MDKKQQDSFYIGAALFQDLDSDEVDDILVGVGLTAKSGSVVECKAAIRAHCRPENRLVCSLTPLYWLSPTLAGLCTQR